MAYLARIRWITLRPFRYDSERLYRPGEEVELLGLPGDEKLITARLVREERSWLCPCGEEFPTIPELRAHRCKPKRVKASKEE